MRFLIVALLSLLCASCASNRGSAPLSSVKITDIKPRFIEEEGFKRVSEYMTGREYIDDRLILRSDPQKRAGYYFTLVLDEKIRRLPVGTAITGEFHTAKGLEAQQYTFKVPSTRPKTKEIFIGLTGKDWPEGSVTPAAWRFTIRDANGAVLATKRSYLWSL